MKKLYFLTLLGIIILSCTKEDRQIVNASDSSSEFRSLDEIKIRVDGKAYNTLNFGELHNKVIENCFPSLSDTSDLSQTLSTIILNYINTKPTNKYNNVLLNYCTSQDLDIVGHLSTPECNAIDNLIDTLYLTLLSMDFINQKEFELLNDFKADIFDSTMNATTIQSKYIAGYNKLYSTNINGKNDSSLGQIIVGSSIGLISHSKDLWINWDYDANPHYFLNTNGAIDSVTTNVDNFPILADMVGGLLNTYVWIFQNADRIENGEDVGGELLEIMVGGTIKSSLSAGIVRAIGGGAQ